MEQILIADISDQLINPLWMKVITFNRLSEIFETEKIDHDPYQHHMIKFNAIMLIKSGSAGSHSIDFKNYTYSKNSVIFISQEQIHRFIDLPNSNNGIIILFEEDLLVDIGASLPNLTKYLYQSQFYNPILNLESELFDHVYYLAKRLIDKIKNKHHPICSEIIKSSFKILLLELYQINDEKIETIGEKKYIKDLVIFKNLVIEHYVEEKKVYFYAKRMNITPKKLNQITQSILKTSAKDYIIYFTILEAKKYLKSSELSLKEIAYEIGFNEPTNFTKFFKKHTGLLPKDFK